MKNGEGREEREGDPADTMDTPGTSKFTASFQTDQLGLLLFLFLFGEEEPEDEETRGGCVKAKRCTSPS